MSDSSGYCRSCLIYAPAPEEFDERKQFLICPRCDGAMCLDRKSIDELTKALWLCKDEISKENALTCSQ